VRLVYRLGEGAGRRTLETTAGQPNDLPAVVRYAADPPGAPPVAWRAVALLVQKFGGTAVGDPDRIRAVADHVARGVRSGDNVVVVVQEKIVQVEVVTI